MLNSNHQNLESPRIHDDSNLVRRPKSSMKVRKIHKKLGVELCIIKIHFSIEPLSSDFEQCSDSYITIKHNIKNIKFISKFKQNTKIIMVPLLN